MTSIAAPDNFSPAVVQMQEQPQQQQQQEQILVEQLRVQRDRQLGTASTAATPGVAAMRTARSEQDNSHPASDYISCGICMEDFLPKDTATLVCCKQKLCFSDVQKLGTCPFCRQEPVFWFPSSVV